MYDEPGARGRLGETGGVSPDLPSPADSAAPEAIDPPEADSRTVPLDFEQALDEFLGKWALVESLVDRLLEEADGQIDAFQRALRGDAWETLRRDAHRMRGGAANLVAAPLASAAHAIEAGAAARDRTGVERGVSRFRQELDRLRRFVADRRSPQAQRDSALPRRRGCES